MQLALFDFDETLIHENSLNALFKEASGSNLLWMKALPALLSPVLYGQGVKLAIKRQLYKNCLGGVLTQQLEPLGEKIASTFTPIQETLVALKSHCATRDQIWIVTASPELFVRGIFKANNWPFDRIIGTILPERTGKFTGEMGVECAYKEKPKRINEALSELSDPPTIVKAYGNLPADGPMLSMAQQGLVVSNGKIALYSAQQAPISS